MSPPLLISIIHYAMCTFGTTVNVGLLVIIVVRTPANLTCYAVLVFSQTLLQALTCFNSAVIFVRLIPKGVSLFLVFSGPAKFLCSYQTGFYIWAIMIHGHAHYCIMLAVCFAYRYYVIRYPSPNFRTVVLIVILVFVPTVLSIVGNKKNFNETIKFGSAFVKHPYSNKTRRNRYSLPEERHTFSNRMKWAISVAGIQTVLEPSAISGISWVCGVSIPSYNVIVIFGRLMYKTFAANSMHMSEKTRASHREIVRGLVMQACLPVLYTFSSGTYIVGQLNILNLEALEYGTHMAGELMVTSSPLMTLYFVQPYRKTVRDLTNREQTVSFVVPVAKA